MHEQLRARMKVESPITSMDTLIHNKAVMTLKLHTCRPAELHTHNHIQTHTRAHTHTIMHHTHSLTHTWP